ncbi:uncharacterized protein LOC124263651 [Haliotis rubra]|uniref:uncharacterized protein LOC124263651 n=1 Tax=Haliotis rubra TaxID=36100 RepID=UPI001EE5FF29|nr:uncharacterized protein LOC124263651 [Haliotis rubra]
MAGVRRVEYLMSQRGGPQIVLDGYVYTRNKVRQTCTHWRCIVKTCTGRCSTVGDFLRTQTEHNHAPDDCPKQRFVSELRKRAREETTQMQTLYTEQLSVEEEDNLHVLPSFTSVSSSLYRHRRKTMPALPTTLRREVHLEDSWTETSNGRRFLLLSDGEQDKILVFSTTEQLQVLQTADTIYMDGTFTACPGLWDQVYIIHARCNSVSYPLVFALLPDRQTTTYVRLFRLLKEKVLEELNRPLAPAKIQTDFELATIRAIEMEFPNAETKGCFFHFSQALWRKTQDLGLTVAYKEDPAVKRVHQEQLPLPYCHKDQVQDTWIDAMDSSQPLTALRTSRITWSSHGWTMTPDSTVTLEPSHNTVGPRTNNNLEGFHSRMNRSLPHRHPNIFRFVEVIRRIEMADRAKLRQFDFGAAPPSRKRVYREIDNRILRLKDTLSRGEKTPLQFLDAVANLIKLG